MLIMSTDTLLDKLSKKDENGKMIIPSHDDLYGKPVCPRCGFVLSDNKDLWEHFSSANIQIDINSVEIRMQCPRDDTYEECEADLVISYSRDNVYEETRG